MFSVPHANLRHVSLILASPPNSRQVSAIVRALPAIPRTTHLNRPPHQCLIVLMSLGTSWLSTRLFARTSVSLSEARVVHCPHYVHTSRS